MTKNLRHYLETQFSDLDVIVFMRVGKFYECFGPNVKKIESVLGLNPSARTSEGFGFPNNGIPFTRFEKSRERLIAAGHNVRVIDLAERRYMQRRPRRRSRL